MSLDQGAIVVVLAAVLALFVWGRLRYDVVAFLALLTCTLLGLVPVEQAFSGFSHPATVTVALVLVLGQGLRSSGLVEALAERLVSSGASGGLQAGTLCGLGAVLSSFMNNVGALALLMPVAIESSARAKRSPSLVLMPLSFATILGGLVTLIGTPPNIIVATIRGRETGEPFAMFDFAPVGGAVALVGVLFVIFVGWRLIPADRQRQAAGDPLPSLDSYVSELRVPKDSEWIGRPVAELETAVSDHDAQVVGLVRRRRRLWASAAREEMRSGDVLIVEVGPKDLQGVVSKTGLELVGTEGSSSEVLQAGTSLIEVVVQPRSRAEGRTASSLALRRRYRVNLLGVSRQGRPIRKRLRQVTLRAGDVLLLQGEADQLPDVVAALGCLPLAERGLRIGRAPSRAAWWAAGAFGGAILASAVGALPLLVALSCAAVVMVLLGLVPLRDLYEVVDWPVIVLLAAMIPVGGALESTGTTALVADSLAMLGGNVAPVVVVGLLLVVTMTLSDLMNNAATSVVMAPVAFAVAARLEASPDPFLMAVAVGASCAFLTPIGHQNNTLVLGPGGYRFGDYWRLGLPLEVLIVAVALPAILLAWPP